MIQSRLTQNTDQEITLFKENQSCTHSQQLLNLFQEYQNFKRYLETNSPST